jgi:polar amino acid transport system permease protein
MDPTNTAPAAPAPLVPPEGGGFWQALGDALGFVLGWLLWGLGEVIGGVVYLFSLVKMGLRELWLLLGDIFSFALDPAGAFITEHLPVLGRYGPRLLDGLWLTAEITFISLLLGGILAIPIALARLSKNSFLSAWATSYIFFFRGTPLLAQIYLIYYGSGQFRPFFEDMGLWGVFREAYWCALIAFSLNTAAYTAEILRGGIEAIPPGEIEAARSLGMGRTLMLRRVILPGAYRFALPAYGNEIILMIKSSAIASIITIFELMGQTKRAFAQSFSFSVYLYAAVLYFIITWLLTRGWKRLEDRLNPQRRPPVHN